MTAYRLTLTHDERRAIDWIGDRYWNGHDLFRTLWILSTLEEPADVDEWIDPRDMTFAVPEPAAWAISIWYAEEGCPCFAPDLAAKIARFCEVVV
jgi:hypothetical protein